MPHREQRAEPSARVHERREPRPARAVLGSVVGQADADGLDRAGAARGRPGRHHEHEPLQIGLADPRKLRAQLGPRAVGGDQAQHAVRFASQRAERPELEAHEAQVDGAPERTIGSQIARHDLAQRPLERELLDPPRVRLLRRAPRARVPQVNLHRGLGGPGDTRHLGVDPRRR
jgi:hypothetical protein